MSKAFVREGAGEGQDGDDEADDAAVGAAVPAGSPNYITPQGHARLREELLQLISQERPSVVSIVSWAASNGDRSENGDYLYGKRRLREIDRRIRFLTRRIESAQVVDASRQEQRDRVFFGASVLILRDGDQEQEVTIVGVDEVDPARGRISWVSPMARALIKARLGDVVVLRSPAGTSEIEILEIRYPGS